MGKELKTKQEIEKARNAFLSFWLLGIGVLICFVYFPIGLMIIFLGAITFIMELIGRIQYYKNPPIYIPVSCPYCNTNHEILTDTRTFLCPECKNRVLVENGTGKKINQS